MTEQKERKKVLGVFHIVMINIIAMDSIRSLPFSAQFGFSLIFFYLIAALMFFIPSGLISAELGTGWPHRGGLYVWIREAFGSKIALIAIWLNWVFNLTWFPTIMALIAGTFAYLIEPSLVENPLYMTLIILSLFWVTTYLNCHGMRFSSLVSTVGAIIGTIIPMFLLITLTGIWLWKGNYSNIHFTLGQFFPSDTSLDKLAYFSNMLFGLLGLEMAATHAQEMKNPKKDYPKATFLSVGIILTLVIFASLSVAIVVPHHELNLVVGALQAFTILFDAFNIPWMTPIISLCIAIGALSGVSAWIIGPTKGILVASQDGHLPKLFTKTNKHEAPTGALVLQGIIVSILCLAFVIMPTVNSSFWLLSIITAQLSMIVYIIFFGSSIKLHHHQKEVPRSYKIPGGDFGIWLVAGFGIFICLFALAVGFIPPKNVTLISIATYESFLLIGMFVFVTLPIIISKVKRSSSPHSSKIS